MNATTSPLAPGVTELAKTNGDSPEQELSEAAAETPEPAAIGLQVETVAAEAAQAETPQPDTTSLDRWQQKLLPFMMYMILGLAVFFFLATFVQLWILHGSMADSPTLSGGELAGDGFQALTQLELYVVERRYHQANIFTMARVWVRYLGFVTGMALSLVGATFILGKMREPHTVAKGEMSAVKFSFAGSSPGIFLVLVGLVLMLSTIFFNRSINVTDGPTYVDGDVLLQWDQEPAAYNEPASGGASWRPGSAAVPLASAVRGEGNRPASLRLVASSAPALSGSHP